MYEVKIILATIGAQHLLKGFFYAGYFLASQYAEFITNNAYTWNLKNRERIWHFIGDFFFGFDLDETVVMFSILFLWIIIWPWQTEELKKKLLPAKEIKRILFSKEHPLIRKLKKTN